MHSMLKTEVFNPQTNKNEESFLYAFCLYNDKTEFHLLRPSASLLLLEAITHYKEYEGSHRRWQMLRQFTALYARGGSTITIYIPHLSEIVTCEGVLMGLPGEGGAYFAEYKETVGLAFSVSINKETEMMMWNATHAQKLLNEGWVSIPLSR